MHLMLNMQLNQQQFYFTIEGNSAFEKKFSNEGAQLLRVQKRLQAQYPNKHEFNIRVYK